jgi:hypothetical protein
MSSPLVLRKVKRRKKREERREKGDGILSGEVSG